MRPLNCKFCIRQYRFSHPSFPSRKWTCTAIRFPDVFELLYLHPLISVTVWYPWISARLRGLAWWWRFWTTTPWGQMTLKARPSWALRPYREFLDEGKEMDSAHSLTTSPLRSDCLWCILNLMVGSVSGFRPMKQDFICINLLTQGDSWRKKLPAGPLLNPTFYPLSVQYVLYICIHLIWLNID